jgi:hypothetical protein
MVASWSISEEKYPQKNQGTAGFEPATSSFNCHLQARLTSAQAAPHVYVLYVIIHSLAYFVFNISSVTNVSEIPTPDNGDKGDQMSL